jgi:hypothetical protein
LGSSTRRPFKIGGSKGITIPQEMDVGEEAVSVAANDRLLLADTKGEVPPEKLYQFFLTYVQPSFNSWWEKEKEHATDIQVYLPEPLWKRFYQVSGRLKATKETYVHAQDAYLEAAVSRWVEEREKDLGISE